MLVSYLQLWIIYYPYKYFVLSLFHVQVLGKRDVLATLLSGEPDRSTPDREQFRQLPVPAATAPSQQQYSIVTRHDQIAGNLFTVKNCRRNYDSVDYTVFSICSSCQWLIILKKMFTHYS